jgi:orotate phosphoribosyltransferase
MTIKKSDSEVQYKIEHLIEASLEVGAIKLDPDHPFTWASGAKMPIYNDNRLLLGNYETRMLVGKGFQQILHDNKIDADGIAGTATAGIAPAVTLANLIQAPLAYVRPEPKTHGMQNQIEGALPPCSRIVVVEDLISTGGSALKAVQALRDAGFSVDHCLCIFSYGFQRAVESFKKMDCQLHTLLTFPQLLEHCKKMGRFNPKQLQLLSDWEESPFEWTHNK